MAARAADRGGRRHRVRAGAGHGSRRYLLRWTFGPGRVRRRVYAIPSLALFGVLVAIPAFFGLASGRRRSRFVSYTLLILLRNIVAGLDGVLAATCEAADGMGFERWRRLTAVDLPSAAPVIIAGLRIVTTVGLVTVAGLVSAGGFGGLITDGLGRNFSTPIVVGAVGSVLLAVALDLAFVVAERPLTLWPVRVRCSRERVAAAAVGLPGQRRRLVRPATACRR